MSIVSNTSPLNYLLLLRAEHILPALFEQVLVPRAVISELASPDSPEIVRLWAQAPPDWLVIREPSRLLVGPPLHLGESHAISLAIERATDRLLIDDYAARYTARALGLAPIGTIGILDLAAEQRLIDLPQVVSRLIQTNFRIAQQIVEELLQRDATRRNSPPGP